MAVVALLIRATGVVLNYDNSGQRCFDLLRGGRWSFASGSSSKTQWQPYGSMLNHYDEELTSQCLENQTLYFIGDSTVRQVFWAAAAKLDGDNAWRASSEAGKHENLSYQSKNVSLSFLWDPYINTTEATAILDLRREDPQRAAVTISTGLWQARHGGDTFMQKYQDTLGKAVQHLPHQLNFTLSPGPDPNWLRKTPVIAVPPPFLNTDWLNPERASTLTASRLSRIIYHLGWIEAFSGLEVAWAARKMTNNTPSAILPDGLHVTRDIAAHQADILLNRICNKHTIGTKKSSAYTCMPKVSTTWSWTKVIGVMLVLCHLYERAKVDQPWFRGCTSILIISTALYCWVADRTLIFDKADKLVSEQLFVFVATVAMALGVIRLKRVPVPNVLPQNKADHTNESCHNGWSSGILSRAQTEEWKGWMQVVILLYHYFGMSKVLWVYQLVRVLVASYLFLTGYGHATYFQKTGDFTFRRVVRVLLRLNLLPCLLAVVMDNTYDFYYFPGLASFWFLITYATFWTPKGRRLALHEVLFHTGTIMAVLGLVLRSERFITMLFSGLQLISGPRINPREFAFRVVLDGIAVFFGMIFATMQHHDMSTFITWRPRQTFRKLLPGITVAAAYVMLIVYVLIARRFSDKFAYNRYHSFLSILPISAYIMLRNVHQVVRRHFAPIFASIGTFSLELFILQYHIWLAADTKGLLRLGWIDTPRFAPAGRSVAGSWTFWAESAIVTIVFVWVSKHCASATDEFVKWFVNASDRDLLIRTGIALGLLWVFNVLAHIDAR
ncbi:hypothetical protein OHC33_008901 [Knufia fluminis]|uniref:Cas1p 10 TM acyl transferase domain-containing protein n=1 Tax=Knufia fluminis TaxID=191047 RepID=A0AAN8F314_9EURO|nr:hypothetical protein OHC33_008901 [Knufia fluminis]